MKVADPVKALLSIGWGLSIVMQIGRKGQRHTYVVQQSIGTGYFNESTGAGWAVAGPKAAPLKESVLAVAVTDSSFIEKPRTGWG